tara:strand:+ start:639 stop:1151 length:513 start_codon:yes stop_codon:yes gene_type:complete
MGRLSYGLVGKLSSAMITISLIGVASYGSWYVSSGINGPRAEGMYSFHETTHEISEGKYASQDTLLHQLQQGLGSVIDNNDGDLPEFSALEAKLAEIAQLPENENRGLLLHGISQRAHELSAPYYVASKEMLYGALMVLGALYFAVIGYKANKSMKNTLGSIPKPAESPA